MKTRTDRLKDWVETLTMNQLREITLELTDFAIDTEYVNFPDSSLVPYYDSDGVTLDGTVQEWDN